MANEIIPTAAGLYYLNEVWPRTIEANVYDVMDFAKTITGRDRLFNLLHLPKISRATERRAIRQGSSSGRASTVAVTAAPSAPSTPPSTPTR